MITENFPNAPIVEAVLEILVRPSVSGKLINLGGLKDKLGEEFPEIGEATEIKTGFQFGNKIGFASEQEKIGFLFRSSERKKVMQARTNGFAFSKLKPYRNWNSFKAEAKKLWSVYYKATKPMKVVRISLRYINRIEIPLPMKDFEEYILTNLKIAPGLPQAISTFVMRFEIPKPEIKAVGIIIEAVEKLDKPNILPLIFDIDVVKEKDYVGSLKHIWTDFEKLHDFKNEIFFESLTEKTKDLFR